MCDNNELSWEKISINKKQAYPSTPPSGFMSKIVCIKNNVGTLLQFLPTTVETLLQIISEPYYKMAWNTIQYEIVYEFVKSYLHMDCEISIIRLNMINIELNLHYDPYYWYPIFYKIGKYEIWVNRDEYEPSHVNYVANRIRGIRYENGYDLFNYEGPRYDYYYNQIMDIMSIEIMYKLYNLYFKYKLLYVVNHYFDHKIILDKRIQKDIIIHALQRIYQPNGYGYLEAKDDFYSYS